MANKLTNLDINEVSLVNKGAIREVFSIIKSEDAVDIQKILKEENGKWFVYSRDGSKKLGGPYDTKDEATKRLQQIEYFKEKGVHKDDDSDICKKLSELTDSDFVDIMKSMMQRYNQINKGGTNMDPEVKKYIDEQITKSVSEAVTTALETINSNFAKINKSIDEISESVEKKKTLTPEEQVKLDEEKKKKEEEAKKSADGITKSMEETSKVVKSLAESMQILETSITKVADSTADIAKRLDTIEKQDNKSNQLNQDDIHKNDDGKKVPFWKSILGDPSQNQE